MLAKPSITEILSYTQQIGAADLLAFAGGVIPVVPAPGDGKLILPIYQCLIYNFGTVDFGASPVLGFIYGAAGSAFPGTKVSGFTGNGASVFQAFSFDSTDALTGFTAPNLNQPINLQLVSGAFALAGIGTASVTAGGTGYAIGDTGTITTGDGTATYRVLTVSGLGAVLTFAITFPGSTYATGAGQATATGGAQPGVGINFTVDVLTLVNGDGSIKVTTLYQVIDVP